MTSRAPGPVRRLSLRPLIWLFHLALPVAGLALLLANPMLDMTWEDHVAHFWMVLITAGLSLVLAVFVLAAAQQHADARLYLFALGFVASAGFLGLHAVATPAVVVAKPNAAFILATPIGLVVAAVLSAWASLDMSPERGAAILRHRRLLTSSIVIGMIVWGGLSLVPGSPLLAQLPLTDLQPALRALALVGIALFGYAAIRSYMRYRRRPSVVLLSLITTMVLLAEALLAIAISPNWHLSWWEWHVLMTIGFAYIAYAAHVEYRREGTLTTLFTAASMEETITRLQARYAEALDTLVGAMESADDGPDSGAAVSEGGEAARQTIARLQADLGLSDGQADVLAQAASALAEERLQGRRLAAVAEFGRRAQVRSGDAALALAAITGLHDAFPGDRLAVVAAPADPDSTHPTDVEGGPGPAVGMVVERALADDAVARAPQGDGEAVAIPLAGPSGPTRALVAERPHGVFSDRAVAVLETASTQLAAGLENARLYRQVDRLFRAYLSPDVARSLLEDPGRARLGGSEADVTVLFADLRGYTPFVGTASPSAVVELLNRYFSAIVPEILAEGGTVTQFAGDAIMAVWGAPTAWPEHALRACRAALRSRDQAEAIAAGNEAWPRFRFGVATGRSVVGNVGANEVRTYTAIGEPTNLAARLQTIADPGSIVIGGQTAARLGDRARLRPLGAVELKGFTGGIEAFELLGLVEPPSG